MTPKPVVFGPRYSTYTRSVLLALEEKGVAYEVSEVDIFASGAPPPGYLDRHPFGRVPAFEHGGFRLYETAAILRYVDEAFPGPALQPGEPRGRARVSQILGVIDSYAYRTMVWDIYVERRKPESGDGPPDEARIRAAVPKADACLKALATLMGEGPHLAGPALSLADLHFVPILTYLQLTPEGERLVAGNPPIARWWERLRQRPGVAATRSPLEPA